MNETNLRMTDSGEPPNFSQLEAWLGKDAYQFWKLITQWIDLNYQQTFTPEWLFGGKKYGWSLRYKKGRSFCTLIPEKNRCAIQIVFGAEERARMETIRNELSESTQQSYDRATTYHDGKWLFLTVDSDIIVKDIERLLAVKRKPFIKSHAKAPRLKDAKKFKL